MASIEQAISVLFDPRQPEQIKKSAIDLTEQAKSDPFFYKFAMQKILELNQDNKLALNLYFWYFQALEEQVRKFYSTFQEPIHRELQNFLQHILLTRMDILQVHIGILNKFSVLYVRVIQEDFPSLWPEAFEVLIQNNVKGKDYLKVFLSVLKVFSEEFTEELGYLTQEQLRKSNLLKDAMRESVLIKAAENWKQVLDSEDIELVAGTLVVMVPYIKWIPLEVTLAFFPYFVKYLTSEQTQIPALQCIDSIVNKKMDGSKKLQVIKDLKLINFITTFNFDNLNMLSDVPKTVTELVDSLGEHLLDCETNPELEVVLECGLKCLNNTDPQISGTVFGMFSKFIRILRCRENLQPPLHVSESELAWVAKIRAVLMIRATLPECDHVGPELSDEEDQFYKYRAELIDIFKQTLELPGSKEVVLNDLERYFSILTPSSKAEEIELLLYLLFHFAEKVMDIGSLLRSQNQYTTLVQKVVNYPIPYKNIVLKMYLENMVRYSTIFEGFPEIFPKALEHFLRNIENPDAEIRKHSIYMLYRLGIKNPGCLVMQVEIVLQQIMKTLNIPGLESDSIKELYKTIGILIGNKKIDKIVQFNLCNSLCDMIISTAGPSTVTMFTEVLSGFSGAVQPELVPKLSKTIEIVLKTCTELENNNDLVKTLCLLLQKIIDILEQSGSFFVHAGLEYLIKMINMETIELFFNVISNCCHRIKSNLNAFIPLSALQTLVLQIIRNVPTPSDTITDHSQLAISTRRSLVKVLEVLLSTIPEFFNFNEVGELAGYLGNMSSSFIESSNPKLSLLLMQKLIEKFCIIAPNHELSKGLIVSGFEVSKEILLNKKINCLSPDVNSAVSELVNLHRVMVKVFRHFGAEGEIVKEFIGFIRGTDPNGYLSGLMSEEKNAQLELKKMLLSQIEGNKSS